MSDALRLIASALKTTTETYTVMHFECTTVDEANALVRILKVDEDVISWRVVNRDYDIEVIKVVCRGTI